MLKKSLALVAFAWAMLQGPPATQEAPVKGTAYFRQAQTVYHTEGAFPGAAEVWSARVLLLHSPKHAGSVGIVCIHVTKTRRECFGTIVLPLGRIKVMGEINDRTLYQLAIVGGIGYYAGATGVAIFQPGLITFLIT